MPNRSNASRSNQFTPAQMPTSEGTTGRLSSAAKQRTRTRLLCAPTAGGRPRQALAFRESGAIPCGSATWWLGCSST
jgi:hypothetical protein